MTEVITNTQWQSNQEMLSELSRFVKAASSPLLSTSSVIDLTRTALTLLQTVPAARDAALEFFCTVYDQAINEHISRLDNVNVATARNSTNSDMEEGCLDGTIEDIQSVLISFIEANPKKWAPRISTWVIDFLGRASKKYGERRRIPHAVNSLNELVLLWMTCRPTNSLIHVVSECFAYMRSDTTDRSVDALIETSVIYSPHFDWVVAHIGSCFPSTVISRVLSCGLRDFYFVQSSNDNELSSDMSSNNSTGSGVPKLPSVVGILSHLAEQHATDLRTAIHQLFTSSLSVDSDSITQLAPSYLLHLGSMSNVLLENIVQVFLNNIGVSELNSLSIQISRRPAESYTSSLVDVIVHVLMKNQLRSLDLILRLLNYASTDNKQLTAAADSSKQLKAVAEPMDTDEQSTSVAAAISPAAAVDPVAAAVSPAVQQFTAQIINALLVAMQRMVNTRSSDVMVDINLLQSLKSSLPTLVNGIGQCQDMSTDRSLWLSKLVTCLAINCGLNCATELTSLLLATAVNLEQLSLFVRVLEELHIRHTGILPSTLARIFTVYLLQPDNAPDGITHTTGNTSVNPGAGEAAGNFVTPECSDVSCLWKTTRQILSNLVKLCEWSRSDAKNGQVIGCLRWLLTRHIPAISSVLSSTDSPCVREASRLLAMLDVYRMDTGSLLITAGHSVLHFYNILSIVETSAKFEASRRSVQLLIHISAASPPAQAMILRGLLEGALEQENRSLLGGSRSSSDSSHDSLRSDWLLSQQPTLLVENQSTRTAAGSRLTVFHSGVIGRSSRLIGLSGVIGRGSGVIGRGIQLDTATDKEHTFYSQECVAYNRQLLIEALWSCSCCNPSSLAKNNGSVQNNARSSTGSVDVISMGGDTSSYNMTVDVGRCLAMTFVELVTPDVMYNSVIWPEEEFMRFTLQRDLTIRRTFDDNPVLWDILDLIATGPGALRHCSCILRSITATLIGQWEMSRDRLAANQNELLIVTKRVLEYLRMSQLLAEPLCFTGDILQFVSSHEVYLLLLNIWRFIKENSSVQGTKPQQRCSLRYTQLIQDVLQSNISSVGHLYSLFFQQTTTLCIPLSNPAAQNGNGSTAPAAAVATAAASGPT